MQTKEIMFWGVPVPVENYIEIVRLSYIFKDKTIPNGRLTDKDCVYYAIQVLTDWMERVIHTEKNQYENSLSQFRP